jgi:hypothetical protein
MKFNPDEIIIFSDFIVDAQNKKKVKGIEQILQTDKEEY